MQLSEELLSRGELFKNASRAFKCLLRVGSTTVFVDDNLCLGLEVTISNHPLAELRRWRVYSYVIGSKEGAVGS